MQPWILTGRRPGPSGYLTVTTGTYELPDGQIADWDIIDGPDTVFVVAMTHDGHVVLARQYRPGPNLILDELPGGAIGPGESPAQAAVRELNEETGYTGSVRVVGFTWPAGIATQRRWAAVATDCVPDGQVATDESEFCEPILVSLSEFRTHLRSGQLTNADIGYLCLDHQGLL